MTSPEVERAVLCAYAERGVDQGALESPSPGFQPGATPFQLPVHLVVWARKKPDVAYDTGLLVIVQGWWPSVTSAKDDRAARWPADRRNARYILVRL
jgi:hypothetical protein